MQQRALHAPLDTSAPRWMQSPCLASLDHTVWPRVQPNAASARKAPSVPRKLHAVSSASLGLTATQPEVLPACHALRVTRALLLIKRPSSALPAVTVGPTPQAVQCALPEVHAPRAAPALRPALLAQRPCPASPAAATAQPAHSAPTAGATTVRCARAGILPTSLAWRSAAHALQVMLART